MEGDAPEPEARAPAGHPHAQLSRRCPSCGGPVYPDQARCLRCGAYYVAAAHAEARMVPQDASGPALQDPPFPVEPPGEFYVLALPFLILGRLLGALRRLFRSEAARR